MGKLEAWEVEQFNEPGKRYADGGGLYLAIAKGGSKSWVLRYRKDGKNLDQGIGGYPAISLDDARRRAAEVKNGGSSVRLAAQPSTEPPRAAQEVQTPPTPARPTRTFEAYARNVHAGFVDAGEWTEMNAYNWLCRAERYIFPMIGALPIGEIDVALLRDDLLRPIATEKPETGKRIRIILRQVFELAVEDGLITENPIDRIPAKRLRRPDPVHRRALPYQDVPDAFHTLHRYRAAAEPQPWKATLLCLSFMVLTAARPTEARNAAWDEVDLAEQTWRIPAAKMKSRRDHVVPLSGAALDILRQAKELSDGRGLIFPNPSDANKPLSAKTLEDRCRKDAIDAVPHGFRSSFRDWAAELSGATWEAIELSLAHKIGTTTEAAYFRTNLLDQRRPLMESWGRYVDPNSVPPF